MCLEEFAIRHRVKETTVGSQSQHSRVTTYHLESTVSSSSMGKMESHYSKLKNLSSGTMRENFVEFDVC